MPAASATPYPDAVVRAAMLLRANALAKGNSGARVETVELLLECLNRGVLPRVPARGSVGASRRPRAARAPRAAARRRGPGVVRRRAARRRRGARARGAPSPFACVAKEGLSLINGTQFMAAQCALGARPRTAARARRGLRVRALARGSSGLTQLVHPAGARAAAAARSARRLRATSFACSRGPR